VKLISKSAALAAILALAACSDKPDDKSETAVEDIAEVEAGTAADQNVAFLEENKSKDGVKVTESGLQYRVITEGAGASPTANDFVTVHYAGRLIDGQEFDSSYARGEPATFPAGRLIKGWTEALQMMKPGDKWELVIPSELAYGERGAGGVIPPNATLVFDVELLAVKTEAEAIVEAEAMAEAFKQEQAAFLEANKTKEGVTTTETGLQYKVLQEGTGKNPTETSMVTVHYRGTMIDGTEFDSSYSRGEPTSFPLNGVIKGWTEGLQLMKEGGKFEFYIPYDIAYGERGSRSIPPFATLIFEVELISVDS